MREMQKGNLSTREKMSKLLYKIRNGNSISASEQLRLVWSLSIPAIMAQLTLVIMQYIDASMVGRLGADESASIGLVASSTWLFGCVCTSFTVGFAVMAAQNIGAGNEKNARMILKHGLLFISILSVAVAAIGVCINGSLPVWLGSEEKLWKDASGYFLVYVCSIPAVGLNTFAGSMLQCSGNMKVPAILNVMMCVLDVCFNAIFIFPEITIDFLGINICLPGLSLGVIGAALGTAVSAIITAIFMLYFLCIKSRELHLHGRNERFKLDTNCLKKSIKISVPVAIEHIVVCGAMVVTMKIVAPLGTVALAANSFAVTAESLCYMPGYGIADAATTLVGQSIGAGRRNLVRHFARMTVVVGIIVMTITGVIMYLEAPLMMSLLTTDTAVQELGVKMLRIEAFAEPMYAATIVATGALRGAGDTLVPSILNLVSLWLVRLPLAVWLAGGLGLSGVWIAMCIELVFRGILFLIRLLREKWFIGE